MNVINAGELSLGEWSAICRHWNKAHGVAKTESPTEDEFDAAMLRARGAV